MSASHHARSHAASAPAVAGDAPSDLPCPGPDAAAADCRSPKRRQILEGAALVFDRHGYDGASMSCIADEAGVSKGTLYNYFDSKSDLFSAFVEDMIRTRLGWILETGGAEMDVEGALRIVARRLVVTFLSPAVQTLHRITVSEAGKFPHLASIFFECAHAEVCGKISAWLEAKHRAGGLHVPDSRLAAEQLIALCKTRLFIRRCLRQPLGERHEAEVDEIVAAAVSMFLDHYGARP